MTRRPLRRLLGWKCAGMCWECWFAGGVASGFLAGCVSTVGAAGLLAVGGGVGAGVCIVASPSSSAGHCSSPVIKDVLLCSSVLRGTSCIVLAWTACSCARACWMLCCACRWPCRSFVSALACQSPQQQGLRGLYHVNAGGSHTMSQYYDMVSAHYVRDRDHFTNVIASTHPAHHDIMVTQTVHDGTL